MRVKKFQAKDMAQAMKMVKSELGPDAIILHSRDMGKGLLGLFMGRGVEVTAAVDVKETRKNNTNTSRQSSGNTKQQPKSPSSSTGSKIDFKVDDKGTGPNEENPLLALSKKLENEKKKDNTNGPFASKPPEKKQDNSAEKQSSSPPDKYLENRLNQLENHIAKLTGMIEHLVPSLASGELPSIPVHTRALYNHLLEQDVDEQLALNIATQIAETTDETDDVWTALKTHLISRIPVAPPIELDFNAKRPKVLMLVGPTGVGKTTTLAKISAQYRYSAKTQTRPKIVFVTADLYRLAAVEQLQKYTEILGSELEVTYSSDEVRQALNKHKDAHLVLFDTAGTSQRNMPQMSTLATISEAAHPTEVHLVLSATTKYNDVVDIIEHFKDVKPIRLIFTKIDESTTYGTILNTLSRFNLPISYLTTGQNVPEDIEIAKADRIAKLLLTKPVINRSILNDQYNNDSKNDDSDVSKKEDSPKADQERSPSLKNKQDNDNEAKNS